MAWPPRSEGSALPTCRVGVTCPGTRIVRPLPACSRRPALARGFPKGLPVGLRHCCSDLPIQRFKCILMCIFGNYTYNLCYI